MRFVKLPEIWFALLALFLVFTGYNASDGAFDINVHDTYFIISEGHLFYFFALWAGIQGFLYWLISFLKKQSFNLLLAFLHFLSAVLFLFNPLIGFIHFIHVQKIIEVELINEFITVALCAHIVGLLLFLVNVVITWRKKKRQ
ncbi:MAG: hypothetical protein ACKOXB_04665 [Flavobacteriales bacterium]